MIRVRCICSRSLEFDDREAGGMTQCPGCGRLMDIPTLEELVDLDEEGTIKLKDQPVEDKPHLAEAARFFTRDRVDETGRSIDLRPTVEEFLRAGVDQTAATRDASVMGRPRYDPLTGELIRIIDLKDDPAVETQKPRAPEPKLEYRKPEPEPAQTPMTTLAVFVRLLLPVNLFVWGLITVGHLVNLIMVEMPVGILYAMFLAAPLWLIAVGHLVNVIEEIGPQEKDELPAPLGEGYFLDGAILPAGKLLLAILVAWAPLWFALAVTGGELPGWATLGLGLLGVALLPGVLLVFVAGGVLVNLAPLRMLKLIRITGWRYWLSTLCYPVGLVLLWIGSGWVSRFGTFMTKGVIPDPADALVPALAPPDGLSPLVVLLIGSLLVAAGVYMLHVSCWVLALAYRVHVEELPWVAMRHISTRNDPMKQLERMRASGQLSTTTARVPTSGGG